MRALLARLSQGRWIIAGSVVLFAIVFGAIAFLTVPVYRASTTLSANNLDHSASRGSPLGALGGLASLAGVNVNAAGNESDTEEALAVLRSREFTEAFIAEQQLLPVLYAQRWDAQAMTWKGKPPNLAKALKYFNRIKVVTEDRQTGLFYVEIEWRDPVLAARWANALVARLNNVMRERAVKRSSAYLDYLRDELSTTQAVETRQSVSRLMERQINERMLADVTPDYSFRVVDRALVPDLQDPVRPNKPLLIMLGAITGAFVGVVGTFVRGAARTGREAGDPLPG